MTRRKVLKFIHWSIVPLFAWFTLVQPADVARMGSGAEQFHSVLGLVFVTLALFWTGDFLARGLASTRAPKLSSRGRTVHRLLHKTLIWGMFCVALTGFALGLTSSTLLLAGGDSTYRTTAGPATCECFCRAGALNRVLWPGIDCRVPCSIPHLATLLAW